MEKNEQRNLKDWNQLLAFLAAPDEKDFEKLSAPTLILAVFLPRLLAILIASDVFPTPGGPTKHSIGLLRLFVFCFTAKYSKIRSFTSSKA